MKSLQDQLLKAGLVDKDKAKKVTKDKHKQEKVARKAGGKGASEPQAPINAMKARHAERDRELNRQKLEQVELKAVGAQIRQLIKMNEVDCGDGDVAYNFVYKNKIKNLHITKAIQTELGLGRLAIVRLNEGSASGFRLVPNKVANKIAQRDQSVVVQMVETSDHDTEEDDNPYADFKVPDDLMW